MNRAAFNAKKKELQNRARAKMGELKGEFQQRRMNKKAVKRGEEQGLSLDVGDMFSVRKHLTEALDPMKTTMNKQAADSLAVDTSEYTPRRFIVDYLIGKFNALPGVRRDVMVAVKVSP